MLLLAMLTWPYIVSCSPVLHVVSCLAHLIHVVSYLAHLILHVVSYLAHLILHIVLAYLILHSHLWPENDKILIKIWKIHVDMSIQVSVSYLGGHLEFLKFLNGDRVAPGGLSIWTLQRLKIHWKQLSVTKFKVLQRIGVWQPDYNKDEIWEA